MHMYMKMKRVRNSQEPYRRRTTQKDPHDPIPALIMRLQLPRNCGVGARTDTDPTETVTGRRTRWPGSVAGGRWATCLSIWKTVNLDPTSLHS